MQRQHLVREPPALLRRQPRERAAQPRQREHEIGVVERAHGRVHARDERWRARQRLTRQRKQPAERIAECGGRHRPQQRHRIVDAGDRLAVVDAGMRGEIEQRTQRRAAARGRRSRIGRLAPPDGQRTQRFDRERRAGGAIGARQHVGHDPAQRDVPLHMRIEIGRRQRGGRFQQP